MTNWSHQYGKKQDKGHNGKAQGGNRYGTKQAKNRNVKNQAGNPTKNWDANSHKWKGLLGRARKGGNAPLLLEDHPWASLEHILMYFSDLIAETEEMFDVANLLPDVPTEGKLTKSHIWRLQLVSLSSALDFYMQELTRHGLFAMYDGHWERTEGFGKIKVGMAAVDEAMEGGKTMDWFYKNISGDSKREPLSSLSAVAGKLEQMGINLRSVANQAFPKESGIDEKVERFERTLDNLSKTRNVIVHKAGRKLSDAKTDENVENITEATVKHFIRDIKNIVKAINSVAGRKPRVPVKKE